MARKRFTHEQIISKLPRSKGWGVLPGTDQTTFLWETAKEETCGS